MGLSVFDKMARHFAWKEDGLKGYAREFLAELKSAKQRVFRGFSDIDARTFSSWFLSVVPDILERLNKTKYSYPCALLYDKDTPRVGMVESHAITNEGEKFDEWTDIISRIVFLFREADEETCQKKNPYEDEHAKIFTEFTEKYGFFGEGLMTAEEKAEAESNSAIGGTMHFPREVEEYKEIEEKYLEEELKLKQYRRDCLKEAMSMLGEWFWDLWS